MLYLHNGQIQLFEQYLKDKECSRATIEKYMRDIRRLAAFCGDCIREKAQLLAFKEHLLEGGYAASSINSMLAAVNCFLAFSQCAAWKMRYLRTQRHLFISKERELGRGEYERLVKSAQKQGDERLALILQTICATGMRVSELKAITVQNLQTGCAQIHSKGRVRQILLPKRLCQMLRAYCRKRCIRSGSVFITKNGRPMDRSNLWKMMKRLAHVAGIQTKKVFPHNLRHLFACTYYQKYKDIVRLADILGHGSVNTTRIYTTTNVEEQLSQMDKLQLVIRKITT